LLPLVPLLVLSSASKLAAATNITGVHSLKQYKFLVLFPDWLASELAQWRRTIHYRIYKRQVK
jgi:hypothetical protein